MDREIAVIASVAAGMYLLFAFQTYHDYPGQSAKIEDWDVFGTLVPRDERCREKLALSLQQQEQRSDAEIASGKSIIGSQINRRSLI